jgi:hypothetical protein
LLIRVLFSPAYLVVATAIGDGGIDYTGINDPRYK